MKDWVCAGAALAGVALLELQGLTAPVASDAVAALQPVFFGISYLRIAEAGRKYPSDDDALAMAAAQVVAVAAVASVWLLGAEGFDGFGHVLALSDQPQTLAVLAWTALASTALTILLQTYALARVPAATASLVVSSGAALGRAVGGRVAGRDELWGGGRRGRRADIRRVARAGVPGRRRVRRCGVFGCRIIARVHSDRRCGLASKSGFASFSIGLAFAYRLFRRLPDFLRCPCVAFLCPWRSLL